MSDAFHQVASLLQILTCMIKHCKSLMISDVTLAPDVNFTSVVVYSLLFLNSYYVYSSDSACIVVVLVRMSMTTLNASAATKGFVSSCHPADLTNFINNIILQISIKVFCQWTSMKISLAYVVDLCIL